MKEGIILIKINDNKSSKESQLFLNIQSNSIKTISDLLIHLRNNKQIQEETNYTCFNNGKIITSHITIDNIKSIEIKAVQVSGKGGFGSLLKGQPAVKKRTNNFDACRDLSGRRLRHVNQEKQLHDWNQKKLDEERMIQEYKNANELTNAEAVADRTDRDKMVRMNKKYELENKDITNQISQSVQYLLKRKRKPNQKNQDNNIENNIVEEEKNNDNNIGNSIPKSKFAKNSNVTKIESNIATKSIIEKDLIEKEDVEDALFALDY